MFAYIALAQVPVEFSFLKDLWASPVETITNHAARNIHLYIDADGDADTGINNTWIIYK